LLSWAKIPTKNIQISVTLLLHFIYKNNYFLPLQAVPDFCVTTLDNRPFLNNFHPNFEVVEAPPRPRHQSSLQGSAKLVGLQPSSFAQK